VVYSLTVVARVVQTHPSIAMTHPTSLPCENLAKSLAVFANFSGMRENPRGKWSSSMSIVRHSTPCLTLKKLWVSIPNRAQMSKYEPPPNHLKVTASLVVVIEMWDPELLRPWRMSIDNLSAIPSQSCWNPSLVTLNIRWKSWSDISRIYWRPYSLFRRIFLAFEKPRRWVLFSHLIYFIFIINRLKCNRSLSRDGQDWAAMVNKFKYWFF